MKIRFAILSLLVALTALVSVGRNRIIVSTDIGGTDPDDNQSMIHLLMYANEFDIEGLVSSPSYGDGSKEEILRMIDMYEADQPLLNAKRRIAYGTSRGEYPVAASLRSVTKQGRRGMPALRGYDVATEGSEWIVECARRADSRPLWVLVWGGLEDVAQALHDAPDIAGKIRVYWIGGPNKKWGVNAYDYIVRNFPDLWMIENNASYRGFIGSRQDMSTYQGGYYDSFMKNAGHLGNDFVNYYDGIVKMGDTPSLLYLMDGDPDNPDSDHWGGRFEKMVTSPKYIVGAPLTQADTVACYSIMEWRIPGPKVEIDPDTPCLTLDVAGQKWPGYYTGDGIYTVRYSPKEPAVLDYTITSTVPGFEATRGTFTVGDHWPVEKGSHTSSLTPAHIKVGSQWFTDLQDYTSRWQGEGTTSRWRETVLKDWNKRLGWLKPGKKNDGLRNTDTTYLRSPEARTVADQVLAFQRVTGGWPKNVDMCRERTAGELAEVRAEKNRTDDSTTDNDATTMQMQFLANYYGVTGDTLCRDAFRRGVEFLLSGQYDNGGWPQFWPNPQGYQIHITYNDDAMVNTLKVLADIMEGRGPYGTDLVDDELKSRIKKSFDKGIDCILNTQIRVDGHPTVWCQQHDRETYAPASARTYELPSFCSQESASIVELLMTLPNPDKRVREAIHGAMKWFDENKLMGYRIERDWERADSNACLVADPGAGPLWGRFYDLENCEIYVCDRDGIPRRSLEELGWDRRNNYSWYNSRAAELYPLYEEWKARWE